MMCGIDPYSGSRSVSNAYKLEPMIRSRRCPRPPLDCAALCLGPRDRSGRTDRRPRLPASSEPPFSGGEGLHPTDHDRFVKELVTLTEIPAPPFKEERRATAYLAMLQQHGLSDVERDEEGNVMGVRRGRRWADAGGARAPRHRVSRGHRRQGPPRGHAPDGTRHGDDTAAWRCCR